MGPSEDTSPGVAFRCTCAGPPTADYTLRVYDSTAVELRLRTATSTYMSQRHFDWERRRVEALRRSRARSVAAPVAHDDACWTPRDVAEAGGRDAGERVGTAASAPRRGPRPPNSYSTDLSNPGFLHFGRSVDSIIAALLAA